MSFEYTATTEKGHNKIVDRWKENGYVMNQEAKSVRPYSAVIPRTYVLRKIHKPNNPLRIIVSSINSATCSMASFLYRLLAQVIGKSVYHVKDS